MPGMDELLEPEPIPELGMATGGWLGAPPAPNGEAGGPGGGTPSFDDIGLVGNGEPGLSPSSIFDDTGLAKADPVAGNDPLSQPPIDIFGVSTSEAHNGANGFSHGDDDIPTEVAEDVVEEVSGGESGEPPEASLENESED